MASPTSSLSEGLSTRPFGSFIARFNEILKLGRLAPEDSGILLAEKTLDAFEKDYVFEPDATLRKDYEVAIAQSV